MKCNVGKKDRIIRMGAGLAIILAGILFNSWLGLIGVVLLLTGLFRFCPAYLPFGLHSK